MRHLTACDILNHACVHNSPQPLPGLWWERQTCVGFIIIIFFFWLNVFRSLPSTPTACSYAGNAMNSIPAPEPPQLMGSLEMHQEGCWGRGVFVSLVSGRRSFSPDEKRSPSRPCGPSAADADPGSPGSPPGAGSPDPLSALPHHPLELSLSIILFSASLLAFSGRLCPVQPHLLV